jgi:hypothetical protein
VRGRTGERGTVLLRKILLMTSVFMFMALQSGLAAEEPRYSIQVGAFKEDERARNLVERLSQDGHLSFYRAEEVRTKGTWYMVYIGEYPSREEARKQAKELKKKGVISEFLIRDTTGTGVTEKTSPEPTLTIKDIEFKAEGEDKEVVLIRASRAFSPTVFPIEEGLLRLVIDIEDAGPYLRGLTELPVGGKFIQKIRTSYHREIRTLRVVLDLSSSTSYKIHQLFFEKENTFALVVERKKAAEPEGSSPPDTKETLLFRAKGVDMKPTDLKEMLLKHHFYASCWDHNQNYCNPEGHFENLFLADGTGTITDRASRLVWEKAGSQKPVTWNEARIYVSRLNRGNFGGHGDWRLPTTEELGTLIERSWQEGRLFISPLFEATQTSCWSVDTMGEERAWVVSFHLGHFSHSPKSFEHYVRAVRSDH